MARMVVVQPHPFGCISAAGKINESCVTIDQLQDDTFSLMFTHVFNVPLIVFSAKLENIANTTLECCF